MSANDSLDYSGDMQSPMMASKSSKPKCLIGCTGSVATLKIPELVAELSPHFEIMIICTTNSSFFLEKSELYNEQAWKKFEAAGGWNLVLKDEDEWQMWNSIGHSVLHIEVRRWADIFIVAPASANVISKAASGICDNFVLSVMRAWDFTKPCAMCPAMNTAMWNHPTTRSSLNSLEAWGWEVLGPCEKVLACNEKGKGAMASVQDIKAYLCEKDLSKRTEPYLMNETSVDNAYEDVSMNLSKSTVKYGDKQAKVEVEETEEEAEAPLKPLQPLPLKQKSLMQSAVGSFCFGVGLGVGLVAGLVVLEIALKGEPFSPKQLLAINPDKAAV
ncbi:flavoprotein [Ochromonadaceae sp. CCMP2298]|nr:flavoprotein [Ochromonadaceae sp. CCMP2298]